MYFMQIPDSDKYLLRCAIDNPPCWVENRREKLLHEWNKSHIAYDEQLSPLPHRKENHLFRGEILSRDMQTSVEPFATLINSNKITNDFIFLRIHSLFRDTSLNVCLKGKKCNVSVTFPNLFSRKWIYVRGKKNIDRCVCYVVNNINLTAIRVYFNLDMVLLYQIMFQHGASPTDLLLYVFFIYLPLCTYYYFLNNIIRTGVTFRLVRQLW